MKNKVKSDAQNSQKLEVEKFKSHLSEMNHRYLLKFLSRFEPSLPILCLETRTTNSCSGKFTINGPNLSNSCLTAI